MNRIARLALVGAAAAALSVGTAGPASAEVDYIPGYLFTNSSGTTMGAVSDMNVDWGWGCGVEIGWGPSAQYSASVTDRRADGASVTVWRKYAAWGVNSGWKRIGYDDTSTSGPGAVRSVDSYCDTKGVWIATCSGATEPPSTATSSRCAVSYKQDNS